MCDSKNSLGLQFPYVFTDNPAQETKGNTLKLMVLAVFVTIYSMFVQCILSNKCLLYTNICKNKYCKINIKITLTCFGVNAPSLGSLHLCN
jgi:hypothetical protein